MKTVFIIVISVVCSVVAVYAILTIPMAFTMMQMEKVDMFHNEMEDRYYNAYYPRLEECVTAFGSISDKRECHTELRDSFMRFMERTAEENNVNVSDMFKIGYRNLFQADYNSLCTKHDRNC